MNDLERDLHDLFQEKANTIDTAPAAPERVLRRGRRRQFGTVLGAAAAVIVAVAATASIVGREWTSIPIEPPATPERTATIHGITVTAPEGWTLIDDWPIASILPTSSETCSFSATGSAIPPSPVDASTSSLASAQASPSCTSQPVSLPAGVPVLQLANFGFSLDRTVCRVGDLGTVDVPSDGVAVYVAAFPDGVATASFLEACPGGATVQTFADRDVGTAYAAVSIVGPQASRTDAELVDAFMKSLDGVRVPSDAAANPAPGYVVAAGVDGGTTWRVEAGFPFRGSGSGIGATLITSDADGHETASSPIPPADPEGDPIQRDERLVDGSGWLLWGTASPLANTVSSQAPDGTRTDATLLPWPDGMRPLVRDTEATQLDGSIWFAVVPALGDLQVNAPETAMTTPAPLALTALTSRVDGSTVVANGSDLGHDWEFRAQDTSLELRVDGADAGGFTAASAGESVCGRVDVSGGTFLLCQQPPRVSYVRVSADASGQQPIADGRWMPSGPSSEVRAWIVALPGEGAGYRITPGDYPLAISWPSRKAPLPGDVTDAGTNDPISWAIRWTDQACPVMEVVFSVDGDTGTSPCLIPWDGSDPAVGGVYGQHEASIIVTGPGNMFCDVDDSSGLVSGAVGGGTVAPVGGWADTGVCILTIPVGDRVTVRLVDANGDRILGSRGAVTIEAVPGSINIVG